MQHNDEVGDALQCQAIAGLLISAISLVLIVVEDKKPKFLSNLNCIVSAGVVDKDDIVDDFGRNFPERPLEPVLFIGGL
jgi:hypothetical protein